MKANFFIVIVLFIGIAVNSKAQTDSISNKKQQVASDFSPKMLNQQISQFYFTGGVGVSLMGGFISSFIGNATRSRVSPSYFYQFTYHSPAYNFAMDYRFTKKSFIGIAVSYQYLKATPVAIAIAHVNYNGPNEIVSRLNMAIRYLHIFGKTDDGEFQSYWGIRAGFSEWQDRLPDNPTYNALTLNIPIYPQIVIENERYPSIQFLVGMRSYFTSHVALDLEAAVGSPYQLAIGVTYIL